MKRAIFCVRVLTVIAVVSLILYMLSNVSDIVKMFGAFLAAMGTLLVYIFIEMFCIFVAVIRDRKQKNRDAYEAGYRTMKDRLFQPYCGPDPGYDNLLVESAYASVLAKFLGDAVEHRFYVNGMREALYEYERECGAP